MEQTKRLMNLQETTEFTGLKKSTIYHYVAQRNIPHIKMGTKLFFDMEDLKEWINSKKVAVL